MTLEELRALLKDYEKGTEAYEGVVALIEAEKTRGIEAKGRANREAQNLRRYKKAFEELGYTDEVDLDEFKESLKKTDTPENTSELTKLQKELKKIQDQLAAEQSEKTQLREKANRSRLKSELHKALGDKVIGSEYAINSLILGGEVTIDDDDEIVWRKGDEAIDFETGVKNFLTANKDIVKNTQNPGSGKPPAGGKPGKTLTAEQLKSMSPEELSSDPELLAQANELLSGT